MAVSSILRVRALGRVAAMVGLCAVAMPALLASAQTAQPTNPPAVNPVNLPSGRIEVPIRVGALETKKIIWSPKTRTTTVTNTGRLQGGAVGSVGLRGPGCTPIKTSVANQYDTIDVGNELTLQLGMVQNEGFGSTYDIPDPDPNMPGNQAFPIEVKTVEFIAGALAAGIGPETPLGYRIEVWDGEPGQPSSTIAFSVDSDPDGANIGLPQDLTVPRVPSGSCSELGVLVALSTNSPLNAGAAKVSFSVDETADPADRMIVQGTSGTNKVSIVVYMRRANNPGGQCDTLTFCDNAFFCTEGSVINGSPNPAVLTYPTRNWLSAISCAGGCPAGFTRFSALPSSSNPDGLKCRPTRDLLQQITYITSQCVNPVQGACCNASTGACAVNQPDNCAPTAYQGDNTICSPNPCPQPSGACCNLDGSCTLASQTVCTGAGGTFRGVASPCATANCPVPQGACCASNAFCILQTAAGCTSLGGNYIGNGIACGPVNSGSAICPIGACCLLNGSCAGYLSQSQCTGQGGMYMGSGVLCSAISCPQPSGACCNRTTFACVPLPNNFCIQFSGLWLGPLTVCEPNPCAPSGVCCRGATCATGLTSGNCTSPASGIGAAFVATSATCNTSGVTNTPCCVADFNKANGITVQDILDYVSAWLQQSPYAKINGNGSTGAPFVQDLLDFFTAWLRGTC